MLCCLFDMVDKNRKVADSFRNVSNDNKLFKLVKLIERWAMDFLECENENDKVFHCSDKAQIISEICFICVISVEQFFNIKKSLLYKKEPALALNRGRKSIYLDDF